VDEAQLIGERIKAARAMAGMSQRALGAAIGVSAMSISKWERGLVPLSSRRLLQLGEAMDRKVEYFLRTRTVKVVPAIYSPHCPNRRWLKPPKQLTSAASDRAIEAPNDDVMEILDEEGE